jgi:lysophospholipase L1-like esterase
MRRFLALAAATLAMSVALPACGLVTSPSAVPKPTASVKPTASARAMTTPRPKPTNPAPITVSGPVVALGDSYTAGLLAPLATDTNTPGCFRSSANYAARVAASLHAPRFIDAACESAGVAAMTSSQRTAAGTNPPQLSALSGDDSVVMLTLSGDDMGFTHVLADCMELSLSDLAGAPCQRHYQGQVAQLISGERPKMATVLSAIRARAPRARVLLLGYPDLFPQRGGCWPAVPITNGDIAFLRGAEQRLDAMLAGVASAAGVTYVDTFRVTVGHDFCQNANNRDVEGLIPATMTYSFHPNSRGQAAMATAVLAALGA